MTCTRGAIVLALSAVLLGLSERRAPGQTQEPRPLPLRLTIEPSLPLARSHAPIAAEIDLQWEAPGLLEGWLVLEARSTRGVGEVGPTVFRYRSDELALSSGGRRFGILMPPMQFLNEIPLLRIQAHFETEEGVIELEEQVLRVPLNDKRECVAAVCLAAGQAPSEEWQEMARSLQLEAFNAQEEMRNQLVTSPRFIVPEELPTDALGYFTYDVLVLSADAFADLRENQLEATLDWLRAGGSVCVQTSADRSLTEQHVRFLNDVAAPRSDSPPVYVLGDDQQLATSAPSDSVEMLTLHRVGLGRAALLRGFPDLDLEQEDRALTEAVLFLWKVRQSQLPSMLEQGRWTSKFDLVEDDPEVGGWALQQTRPFAPQRLKQWNNLATLLMPDSTRGVPMLSVVAILVTFLLAIAPGDYFLLGYLKRRKYTWLLFPALSILFTLFTVQLAQSYMGTADQRKALVIVDIAEGNRVARTTRFELLFTATQKEVDIPVKRALLTPLDDRGIQLPDAFQQPSPVQSTRTGYLEAPAPPKILADPPLFSGVLPFSYSVGYEMQQWSPRLNRQTTVGGEAVDLNFDWDSVDVAELVTTDSRERLGKAIADSDPGAQAWLYYGHQGRSLKTGTRTSERANALLDLVRRASIRGPNGLLSIVSQLSPCGGRFFEDLALLDASDVRQSLLLIVQETEDEVIVYRRLYFDEEARTEATFTREIVGSVSSDDGNIDDAIEQATQRLLHRTDGEVIDDF